MSIQFHSVSVRFQNWGQEVDALCELDFEIPEGQWIMIAGPNGSGKSTLLSLLCGRLAPSSGKIMRNGQAVSPEQLRELSFLVHQDPTKGVAPSLTVGENLWISDARAGKRSPSMRRYREILAEIGLDDRLKQPANSLSVGERQLLSLECARLSLRPLVLLDEPTAALDPQNTERCLMAARRLREEGRTVVHVTHDTGHQNSLGDHLLRGEAGRFSFAERTRATDRNHPYC